VYKQEKEEDMAKLNWTANGISVLDKFNIIKIIKDYDLVLVTSNYFVAVPTLQSSLAVGFVWRYLDKTGILPYYTGFQIPEDFRIWVLTPAFLVGSAVA